MIKVTKISTIIVIFYVMMYVQTWGDNYLLFYGASLIAGCSMAISWFTDKYVDLSYVPYGVWNNLVMVIYSVITGIFIAYDFSALIDSSITYAAFSIICVAICYVSSTEKSFEWVFKALVALAVTCAVYMLTRGSRWEGYGRTLSSYNNPHTFAAVMNLGIFSITYLCKKQNVKESIIAGIIIFFFLYCIIECGSRKYLLASVFLVGIWGITQSAFIWKKRDSNQRIMLIIILIILIGLSIYFYRHVFSNTLSYARLSDNNDEGNKNRIKFYQTAFEIMIKNPVFGGGYDQFQFWSGYHMYSHSTYAEAIADFGIVGCILYFAPILYCSYVIMRHTIKQKNDYQSWLLLALCLAELFIGIGQIFFMAFQHFLAWSILFYQTKMISEKEKQNTYLPKCKYIKPQSIF